MSGIYDLFVTDPENPISDIYDVLVTDPKRAIPIFLHIDGERIALDLKKTTGVLLYGDNAVQCLRKMVEKLPQSGASIRKLETGRDVDTVYNEMLECYWREAPLPIPQIVISEDIEMLYESSAKTRMNLNETMLKGHWPRIYFLCSSFRHSLPGKLSINFKNKIELFDSPQEDGCNAIFFNSTRKKRVKFDMEDFS